jgi:polyferredoxin
MKQNLNNSLLRGGFCAVWVFGILISFYEFLYAATAEMGSAEQGKFTLHAIGCILVTAAAACIHAYLIREANGTKD